MSGATGARPADAPQPRQPQPPQVPPPPKQAPGQSQDASTPASSQAAGRAAQPQPHHPPQAYSPPSAAGAAGAAAHQHTGDAAVRRPRTGASSVPRLRQARLRVSRVDPWSVMKVGFLLSVALGICTVVAVTVLWLVMDAMGVFSTVGGMVSDATSTDDGGGFDLESALSLPRVVGFTGVVAGIDVVLGTALATLGAFAYNLSGSMVGGVEITLVEDQ